MRRSVTALTRPTLTTVLTTALVLGAAGLAGATSGSGLKGTPVPTTTGPTTPVPTTAGAIAHPTGAEEVVLQVTTQGGFVTVETSLSTTPSYTLLGNGTVITQAPVILIYPGPAVTPFNQVMIGESGIQQVLHLAAEAGLLDPAPVDYGDMGDVGVADAPTTSVVLNAAGRTVRHDAYALSFDDSFGGLSPSQRRARQALTDFLAALPQDPGPNAVPYVPKRLAVYVGPYRGELDGGDPVVWPLASDLDTVGNRISTGLDYRCVLVTGKDLTTLRETLRQANSRTPWVAEPGSDRRYGLVVRPVLPGTAGCPDDAES